jgi:recombination protein RecR
VRIPRAIQKLTESFERLPGIGPKTAQRLTFYLLHVPQAFLDEFSQSVSRLKENTKVCSLCFSIDETDPCSICSDPTRDQTKICVVEQPLDVLAIEKSGSYQGLYHVLHGVINPLDNIGPDELHIYDLLPRLKNAKIAELILATNPTMEGEATAMFISQMLKKNRISNEIKLSRIGRGLPTGADLQYADDLTLKKALEGRREF